MILYFVHGLNGSSGNWKSIIERVSKKEFDCHAISLRKGLNLRKTHLMDYIHKVCSLVTSEDIVIGHSMGGLIMQKVAEQTQIKAGIGICPAPPSGISMPKIPIWRQLRYVPNILFGIPFKPSFGLVKKVFLNDLNETTQRNIYDQLQKQSAHVSFETMKQKIGVDEKKIISPLYFVGRNNDKTIPVKVVKKIAEKYNAPYEIVDGNHYIFNDSQKIARIIISFLNQIISSRL